MTRKRWFMVAGIFAVCVCLALATPAMLPPLPGIMKAKFDRIEDGMTAEQVESIFGRPPTQTVPDATMLQGRKPSSLYWDDEDGSSAAFCLDDDGKVTQRVWVYSSEGIDARFRRWIRWPWW